MVDGTTFQLPDRFNDPQCREMGASSTLSTDLMPKGAHRADLTVLDASESAVIQFMGGFTVNFVDEYAYVRPLTLFMNLHDLTQYLLRSFEGNQC